jgi:phospholipid transport system substrate-binding protein
MRIAKFCSFGALLFACLAAAATPTPTRPAVQSIQQTVDSLLQVIREGKGYFDSDPDRFYKAVEDVLDPVIDFDTFSRGVMAVYYKRATPAQRQRFEENFRSALVHTYGKALLSYGDEKVEVLPDDRPQTQPDRDSVKTEITSKEGKVYPVIYSMRLGKDGAWRVYNLIINGINIGLTYRNQFSSSMKEPAHRGNLDAVIANWGDTIANVDPSAEAGKADAADASKADAAGSE